MSAACPHPGAFRRLPTRRLGLEVLQIATGIFSAPLTVSRRREQPAKRPPEIWQSRQLLRQRSILFAKIRHNCSRRSEPHRVPTEQDTNQGCTAGRDIATGVIYEELAKSLLVRPSDFPNRTVI